MPNDGDPTFIESFIQKIRGYKCLYDKTNIKEYKDFRLKNAAYEEIAHQLRENVEITKKRWANLFKKFNEEKLIEARESRSGAGASDRLQWPYYQLMKSFLKINDLPRSTLTNVRGGEPRTETPSTQLAKKRKQSSENSVVSEMNNVYCTVNKINDVLSAAKKPRRDEEDLIGELVLVNLNKMSPRAAKRTRKILTNIVQNTD